MYTCIYIHACLYRCKQAHPPKCADISTPTEKEKAKMNKKETPSDSRSIFF